MKLSDAKVKNLKPRAATFRTFDGGGLYVEVRPNGSKLWRWKYRQLGKEKLLAFGVYPDVSLAQARSRRDDARRQHADGGDPGEQRKLAKLRGESSTTTFQAVADDWLEKIASKKAEATRKAAGDRLRRLVYPHIGSVEIAALRPADVIAVLNMIAERGTVETAHRVRQVVGQVIRYAIAHDITERDITSAIRGAIAPTTVKHMAAITTPSEVGPLLRAMDNYHASVIVQCALRLAPLTFVRPGELRHAEWSEFDLGAAEWSIPAAKMKMRSPHLVPLSRQALAVVTELKKHTGDGRYLFPSFLTGTRPMSNNTINSALRRMGFDRDTITGHGFRAMARTLLDEQLGVGQHIIEHQLAHAVKDANGRAYNRTSHLPERRKMMQTWADYLDELKADNVVQFPTRAA